MSKGSQEIIETSSNNQDSSFLYSVYNADVVITRSLYDFYG